MVQAATAGQLEMRDVTLEGACPTCDGPLAARFSQGGVLAWCGACRRLTRPLLVPGPQGATIVHRPEVA